MRISKGWQTHGSHITNTKAARTRKINETLRRIKEAHRTHFPAASYAMNETYEGMFLDDVASILEDVL
jgi:aminoglycoside N3'-acetyltransferase